jgi:hypothetical protein
VKRKLAHEVQYVRWMGVGLLPHRRMLYTAKIPSGRIVKNPYK